MYATTFDTLIVSWNFNKSYSLTYAESCGKELKLPKTTKNDHFSKVYAFLLSDFHYKAKKKKKKINWSHNYMWHSKNLIELSFLTLLEEFSNILGHSHCFMEFLYKPLLNMLKNLEKVSKRLKILRIDHCFY